jgi:hypothetical protein
MFRRIITIILILLVIMAILLGLSWFMARRNAVKNGTTTPTFKEFLGIGTNTGPRELGEGTELTSDFTVGQPEGGTPGGNTTGSGNTSSIGTSQFTNEPMSPSGPNEFPENPNNIVTPAGGNGSGTVTPAGGGTVTTPAPLCSDADLTITFTPEEIIRLNTLEKRFMTIAQNLYTDGDVDNELANHDTLKAKYDRINELNAYCVAKSPLIGNPALQGRVPTPFWRGSSEYFHTYGRHYRNNPNYQGTADLADQESAVHSLERILRLSLW